MGMFVGSNGGNDGFSLHSLSADTYDTVQNSDIEAAPVVHGKWVLDSGMYSVNCSLCGHMSTCLPYSKLCPNCGAIMEQLATVRLFRTVRKGRL